jgi:hypothetical protein
LKKEEAAIGFGKERDEYLTEIAAEYNGQNHLRERLAYRTKLNTTQATRSRRWF